jgi:hypothetical protein
MLPPGFFRESGILSRKNGSWKRSMNVFIRTILKFGLN